MFFYWRLNTGYTPKDLRYMTMEKQPFEDVFPIVAGDFPAGHASLPSTKKHTYRHFSPKLPHFHPPPGQMSGFRAR